MFHEMFQFRQNCCFQWKTPIQTFLKCWLVCFFWGSLQQQCHPLAVAVLSMLKSCTQECLHSLFLHEKKCDGIVLQSPLTRSLQLMSWLQSLLNNKSVLTSLLQQRQRCRRWRLANFHHRCHSRGLLPCLCLHNRTWKVAGVLYAKNH